MLGLILLNNFLFILFMWIGSCELTYLKGLFNQLLYIFRIKKTYLPFILSKIITVGDQNQKAGYCICSWNFHSSLINLMTLFATVEPRTLFQFFFFDFVFAIVLEDNSFLRTIHSIIVVVLHQSSVFCCRKNKIIFDHVSLYLRFDDAKFYSL